MAETTQSATLSALKRADFNPEPAGDRISLTPAELNALLLRASVIQDPVELLKYQTGAEVRLVARCLIIVLSWSPPANNSDVENMKILTSIRAILRQTDAVMRRSAAEIVITAYKISDDAAAEALIERLARVAPEVGPVRIGYVRVEHPTRFTIALEGALDAWRLASGSKPVREGNFECPEAVRA
ncbi:MAG: hypothetical protein AAFN79_04810 [Pseudomonadota bacterium]